MKLDRCCGIVIENNNRVLLGKRSDGQGWGLAGGKLEDKEGFYEAALRELMEEFGIRAIHMEELGRIQDYALVKGEERLVEPLIYLCRSYEGTPRADGEELLALKWYEYEEAVNHLHMFSPSKRALMTFKEAIFL